MPVTIPDWSRPVFDFYNLNWPDVDEDAIAALGPKISDVGMHAFLLGTKIRTQLNTLAKISESKALDTFAANWSDVVTDYLEPISDAGLDAIRICGDLGIAVYTYKHAVLGVLTVQVGSSLLTLGVKDLVAKAAARDAIEAAMEGLAMEIMGRISQTFKHELEERVLNPIRGYGDEVIKAVSSQIRTVAVDLTPELAIADGATMLNIRAEEVQATINEMRSFVEPFVSSIKALIHHTQASSFSTPTPVADLRVSTIAKGVIDHFASTLDQEVEKLGREMVEKLAGGLLDLLQKVQEALEALDGAARKVLTAKDKITGQVPISAERSEVKVTRVGGQDAQPSSTTTGQVGSRQTDVSSVGGGGRSVPTPVEIASIERDRKLLAFNKQWEAERAKQEARGMTDEEIEELQTAPVVNFD